MHWPVTVLDDNELPEVESFLRIPEIDQSFSLPLSARRQTLEDRVYGGCWPKTWLGIRRGSDLVACRKLVWHDGEEVVFTSTLVIQPGLRGLGLGRLLLDRSETLALERGTVSLVRCDCAATSVGFLALLGPRYRIIGEYDDPERRPVGVRSLTLERRIRPTLNE